MQQASRKLFSGLSALVLLTVASACGESSTAPGGEQELISRVTLTLTPAVGGSPIEVYIDDPDGNGPQAPSAQVGSLTLASGATYTGRVKFENRLENPPEDITEEVEEESNEHQVFYTVPSAGLWLATLDSDLQGLPLGLNFEVTTGTTAATGTIRVVLCHYGDSPKTAAATSCSGDTDIDVTFNYTIAGS